MRLIFKSASRKAIFFFLFLFSQVSLAQKTFSPLPPDEDSVPAYRSDVAVRYPEEIVSLEDFADPLKSKLCSQPIECQLLTSNPQYYDFYQKQELTKFSFYGDKGEFKRAGDYIYSSVFKINYNNEEDSFVNIIDFYKSKTDPVKFQAFDLKKGILVTFPISQPWFSLDHKDCVILKFERLYYQNGDKCKRVYGNNEVPKLRSWALNESLTKVALIYSNGFLRIFDAKNGQLLTEGNLPIIGDLSGFLNDSIFYIVYGTKDALVFLYFQTDERDDAHFSFGFKEIKRVVVPFKNEPTNDPALQDRTKFLTEVDIGQVFHGNLELSNLAKRTRKDLMTELYSPNRTIQMNSLSKGPERDVWELPKQKMIYHNVRSKTDPSSSRSFFLFSVNRFNELFNFRFDSQLDSGSEIYPMIMRSEDKNGKFVVFAGHLTYGQYDDTSYGVRLDVYRAKKVLVEGGGFERKEKVMPDCFRLNTGNMATGTQLELSFNDVFTPPTQICYGFEYKSMQYLTFDNFADWSYMLIDSKILDPEVRAYFDGQLLPTIFEAQKFSVIGAENKAEVYEYETKAFTWKQNTFKIRMHKGVKSVGGSFETTLFLTLISADGKKNETFRYE